MEIVINPERTLALMDSLVALWRSSAGASHRFLTEEDMEKLLPAVRTGVGGIETLVVALNNGQTAAFMGIDGAKVEMLFVAPELFGQGLGRELMTLAISRFGVCRVDVNEQNPAAAGFYRRMGFEVAERTEFDEQGNPFPLLRMKLWDKNTNP